MKFAKLLTLAIACASVAAAIPITATYTTSGSAGNWQLDFTLTNNLTSPYTDQGAYFWGVDLPTDIIAAPGIFGTYPNYNAPTPGGGPTITYNTVWYDSTDTGVAPGDSLSGFIAGYTGATLPSTIDFFVYTAGDSTYAAGDNFNGETSNPGFVGVAASGTEAPEPSSAWLLGAGLGAVGLLRRRFARFIR